MIPAEIRNLILRYIDSVEMLEVLLVVFRTAPKSWTAEELAGNLRSSTESVESRLNQLVRAGFFKLADQKFEYAGSRDGEKEMLAELDRLYTKYRIRIIELIYSRPNDRIRTFADAFRFKKDKTDG